MRRESEAWNYPEGSGREARAWAGGKQVGAGVTDTGYNGSLEQPCHSASSQFRHIIQALGGDEMRRDVNRRASLSQSEEEEEGEDHQHAGGGTGCSS